MHGRTLHVPLGVLFSLSIVFSDLPLAAQTPSQGAPPAQVVRTAEDFEQEIDSLIERGDLEAADRLLRGASAQYPDHPGLQASALLLQFRRASDRAPDEPEVKEPSEPDLFEQRVDSLIFRFKFGRAEELLDKAQEKYPDHPGLQASGFILALFRAGKVLIKILGISCVILLLLILLLLRKQPMAAASIYIVGIYIVSLPVAVILAVLGILLSTDGAPPELRQVVLVGMSCFVGALGGAIHSSFLLAHKDRSDIPDPGVFEFFFYKPLNGFFLAAVMYIALMSGQLVLFGESVNVPNNWSVALLAALTGILSDGAMARLRQLGVSMFGSDGDRRASRAAPKRPRLRSRISAAGPNSLVKRPAVAIAAVPPMPEG